ncbi:MAG TPA: glycoside hydrolase family 2 TIM barrel-domain containing protein, partial [Victivallales bacterium]|nr:glycoside hydrolase family 2 TIM barrel-domain containing protein [Victivallales bacterium]
MNNELLKNVSEEICETARQMAGKTSAVSAEWKPLRAPGFVSDADRDARKVFKTFFDWTKLTVSSKYVDFDGNGTFFNTLNSRVTFPLPTGESGEVAICHDQSLPDQWTFTRNYHHAWYFKDIDFGNLDPNEIWMRFDSVAHYCVVFVNGKQAGSHIGGYTPFEFNISPFLNSGKNTIALFVVDEVAVMDRVKKRAISQLDNGVGSINSHYAGIRGGIYFESRPKIHISRIRVKTSTRNKVIEVESWMRGGNSDVTLKHEVFEWPNGSRPVLTLPEISAKSSLDSAVTNSLKIEWSSKIMEGGFSYPPLKGCRGLENPRSVEEKMHRDYYETTSKASASWPDPKLWSPVHPNLYVLRTTMTCNGISETVETRFGFREFWIEGKQFMLNGKPIRLFGDGSHQFGFRSVVPGYSIEYGKKSFEFLKNEFNIMSVRLHGLTYPQWAILAADEAGILVINQNGLRHGRVEMYEEGKDEFIRNMELQTEEWYWRDANSPSVVIWDVENELIRGHRTPEREKWVLKLDDFIRKHYPEAIIEHSGAAYYKADQQIIHVHMQEQYNRLMRQWKESGKVPLMMGEFWMGGRGDTRLPNGYEYSDREDYHREEARLYREHMLEMRNYGVCGIMPHRLTRWPVTRTGPLFSRDDIKNLNEPPFHWRFKTVRSEAGRGIAPIIVFAWPRSSSAVTGETFERDIVVCNDSEEDAKLQVKCEYRSQKHEWKLTLKPAEQKRFKASFTAELGESQIKSEIFGNDGNKIEEDVLKIHSIAKDLFAPVTTSRQIYVVPEANDFTRSALNELGIKYIVSAILPEIPEKSIVIVPPGAKNDALGRDPETVRRYLENGGRLLVLTQNERPQWLPLGLPFWSSMRPSAPEFDRGGWEPINKDLFYSRKIPVYANGHTALAGLEPVDFNEWNPVDGRIGDDCFTRANSLKVKADGPYRVLLGASRRENTMLTEFCAGKGSGFLCQAQVLEQRIHPAARALFFNLLRYLDGPAWTCDNQVVGLLGNINPKKMAGLTGIEEKCFVNISIAQSAPKFVIAGDGADTLLLAEIAKNGSTVLVMSCETCNRLPGYQVEQLADGFYSGTRNGVLNHPLFWGIASASFL